MYGIGSDGSPRPMLQLLWFNLYDEYRHAYYYYFIIIIIIITKGHLITKAYAHEKE